MQRLLTMTSATAQGIRTVLKPWSPLNVVGSGVVGDVSGCMRRQVYSSAQTHLPAGTHNNNGGAVLGMPLAPSCGHCEKRHQSTTPTNAEAAEKKKRKRRPRYAKYVELLEVTAMAANERKSRVTRLKAKKLQEFMQTQISVERAKEEKRHAKGEQPIGERAAYRKLHDMVTALNAPQLADDAADDRPVIYFHSGESEHTRRLLSDPEEVRNILGSYHNFRDITETISMEEAQEEAQEAEADYAPYSALSAAEADSFVDPLESVQPYISPKILDTRTVNAAAINPRTKQANGKTTLRYKSKVHNNEEQERLAKERALRINLNTYLNVCVTAGMLNRAISTILTYRQRAKRSATLNSSIITIELYNILLHGMAEKGASERLPEIFTLIEADGLQFNEQTFAAIFECYGRAEPSPENTQCIKQYIDRAQTMGYTLNDIMDRSKFLCDQRDIALDAIQRVQPDFQPCYTPPAYGYDNILLNHLNTSAEPATSEDAVDARGGRYSKEQLAQLACEQLKVELDGHITIASIEKTKAFGNAEYCRSKLAELEGQWHTQICNAIRRDLNTLRAQVRFKPHGYMTYYTYLRTLDTAQYADILLKEIYKLAEGSETFSPTVGQLYRELGQKVQQRYQIEQKKRNGTLEKMGDIYADYCAEWADGSAAARGDNMRQAWQRLVHAQRSSGPSMDVPEIAWPANVLSGVGRFLYNILMRDIKIDTHIMRQKAKTQPAANQLPAFYTLFRNQGRLVKEEVKPHPVLARLLRASRQQTLTFGSNLVPMLCPPQPWSTAHTGGYLLNKSDLIRLPQQALQQWERINGASAQSIYPALDSLNQLAGLPWRVNTDILDVIIEVFQNGGDHKLEVPQPPNSLPPLPSMLSHGKDAATAALSNAERAKLFREKLAHRRRQAEMYSLWCDTLYRLSLANHYRDKVFWLPHNMDFRGRVYPVPPHLNHLGSDLARSMLIFDEARPLGVDGFSWLKLHCINLTGLKKRDSVRERLLYAEEIMPDILDSADRPLTGRMWWSKSDEPWQTLACCMEIAKVQRSPSPADCLSRFPIHQDGSCNGLQHYAALGRDKAGAISVNLAPAAVPQDVYSAVAVLVEKSRKADAKAGIDVAVALDGYVRRKVIKQTVMTTVYGVTRYGARLQIARQLKDIDDFPKDSVWPASTYLTTKTFESLREMFTSTREIQDWFTECARLIAGICSQNVEWVTPLGLPVVQPYSRQEMKRPSGSRLGESMPMDLYERPNVMKQKNAFPPNFIHSLDSSHMMLTSLHCERAGFTFVSVHDCFWTHACTVPEMNRICREQFVALHSQPILEELSEFLSNKFSFKELDFFNDGSTEDLSKRNLNRMLRQLPHKGNFDLQNVLDSVYFFS